MKIEVLSVPGCPQHAAALALVRAALADAALAAAVEEYWVRTPDEAAALGFVGSPTIRVNGRDVAPAATAAALACRLPGDLPSLAALLAALETAR